MTTHNTNHYKGKMTAAGILLLIMGALTGGMVQDFRNSPVIDATLSEGMRGLRADISRLEGGLASMQLTIDSVEGKTEDRYKGRDAERDFQKVDQQFATLSEKVSATRDRVNILSERIAVMEANDVNQVARVETLKEWVIQHSLEPQNR